MRRRDYAVPLCKHLTMGIAMIEWFDDLALGMRFKSGESWLRARTSSALHRSFDPQPYHLDVAAAKQTPSRPACGDIAVTCVARPKRRVLIGPPPVLDRLFIASPVDSTRPLGRQIVEQTPSSPPTSRIVEIHRLKPRTRRWIGNATLSRFRREGIEMYKSYCSLMTDR